MKPPKAYVIGAGLAGLSAATILAARGAQVELIEAAGQAGGRCRSYFDAAVDGVIDNGNHLVLSGNRAVNDYLKRIGAEDRLSGPPHAEQAFVDLASGARWTLRPDDGPIPFWTLREGRRVPGTHAGDYLAYARLTWANRRARIGELVSTHGALWDRLMRPFFLAALNTDPAEGSAALAGALIRETFAKGGRAYCPRIAHPTLAAAFIDPALAFLQGHGAAVRLASRVKAITFTSQSVAALEMPETLPVGPRDAVILAVPPWVARELVPGLETPGDFRAIVNAHFKCPAPADLLGKDRAPLILGVLGGVAEWIFAFEDRISVTVSAADAIVDRDREELARILWGDVAGALGLDAALPGSGALPPWQIVKEKRATFAATPEQDARRPRAATRWRNLILAGDWTQTGLPATIEGALRSGETAAALARRILKL